MKAFSLADLGSNLGGSSLFRNKLDGFLCTAKIIWHSLSAIVSADMLKEESNGTKPHLMVFTHRATVIQRGGGEG